MAASSRRPKRIFSEVIVNMRRSMSWQVVWSLLYIGAALGTANADEVRKISVSGNGQVAAEPDRAIVSLGVEARKPKIDDARAEVARTIDAVLKLTRELKIDPKFVRATRVTVQAEYDWNNQNRERTLLGYLVARQVQVELRDLEKLGVLLERAVDLGANQVSDPQLDSSRRHELEREALSKAVEDARLNAEALARAAGAKLGAVRTLSASSDNVAPPVPLRMEMKVASSANAPSTYQSGEMTFNANVQAEYDLTVAGP